MQFKHTVSWPCFYTLIVADEKNSFQNIGAFALFYWFQRPDLERSEHTVRKLMKLLAPGRQIELHLSVMGGILKTIWKEDSS